MKKNICHCAHCLYEPECAANGWSIYILEDPCCPNMKEGKRQQKQFEEDFLSQKDYIEKYLI